MLYKNYIISRENLSQLSVYKNEVLQIKNKNIQEGLPHKALVLCCTKLHISIVNPNSISVDHVLTLTGQPGTATKRQNKYL